MLGRDPHVVKDLRRAMGERTATMTDDEVVESANRAIIRVGAAGESAGRRIVEGFEQINRVLRADLPELQRRVAKLARERRKTTSSG